MKANQDSRGNKQSDESPRSFPAEQPKFTEECIRKITEKFAEECTREITENRKQMYEDESSSGGIHQSSVGDLLDPEMENRARLPGMIAVPTDSTSNRAFYVADFTELRDRVNSGTLNPDDYIIEFATVSEHPLAFKKSKA